MKQYTIVYSIGRDSAVQYDRVETEDLSALLKEDYNCNCWFVFEGWPKEEGE